MHLSMLLEMAADGFGDRVAVGPAAGRAHLRRAARRAPAGRRRGSSERGVEQRRPRRRSTPTSCRRDLFGSGSPACRSSRSTTGWPTTAARAARRGPRPSVVGRRRRRGRPGRRRSTASSWSLRSDVPRLSSTTVEPVDDAPLADPDDDRHPAVHERHDRRAEGGGAAPPAPHVVRHRHGRVHGRRRGRGRARERAAVPHRRHLGRRSPASTPAGGCATCRTSRPRAGSPTARDEAVTQAMVVPTMLGRILDVVERDGEHAARSCATSPTAAAACRCR